MKQELSIKNALTLLNSNKEEQGIEIIKQILEADSNDISAHQIMVKLGFKNKDLALAENHLLALRAIQPFSNHYLQPLIEIYNIQSRWPDLSSLYIELAKQQPSNAEHQFNCGYYLKLSGKFEQAIDSYNQALEIGISDPHEVYLNIAIIYSEHLSEPEKALALLSTAIKKYPSQDSLKYNLANVYEQLGNKELAFSMFQSAYSQNPLNLDALARQADIYKIKTKDDQLITAMESAFNSNKIEMKDKINIAYALGKGFDDCQEYQLAANYYQKANELDQKGLPLYDPHKYEQYINDIINTFNENWFKQIDASPEHSTIQPPIFICGMFRSGSTLCEQILASHSAVSAGGEQEFFHRSILNHFPDFPEGIPKIIKNKGKLLNDYIKEVNQFKFADNQLTDKRPDNFIYLGLIKSLMPNAKIVWTKRFIFDNCLSVFFLRLGASMPYSTKIENILHFYRQQERLMNHWSSLFGNDIFTFDYDELISDPKANINELLAFADLPWQDSCLNFHKTKNQVKTASVWQVRQPLYTGSSGRWKNYQQHFTFDS